jgi:hypothetical protein
VSKHTPGPWFYRKGDEWSHSVVTHHEGLRADGEVSCWTVADINKQREPEHEANAHLISAAPDLLNALRRALKLLEYAGCSASDEAAEARAAIATGAAA